MANELIGRFYLKKTNNGNLLGEFSNNESNKIFSESADSVDESCCFIGDYNSTWQEDGLYHFAKLTIAFRPETNKKIFTLKWVEGSKTFIGEGMLCDNILIGDYRV